MSQSITFELYKGLIAMGHFCQTQLAGEIDEGSLRERTDTVRMRDQSPFPAAVSTFNNSTSWLKHLVDTSISA